MPTDRDELMRCIKWEKKKKKETEQHVQCAPISAYVFKGDNTSTTYICIKYTQKNT